MLLKLATHCSDDVNGHWVDGVWSAHDFVWDRRRFVSLKYIWVSAAASFTCRPKPLTGYSSRELESQDSMAQRVPPKTCSRVLHANWNLQLRQRRSGVGSHVSKWFRTCLSFMMQLEYRDFDKRMATILYGTV